MIASLFVMIAPGTLCLKRSALSFPANVRHGWPILLWQPAEFPQVVARLVEATTAKRHHRRVPRERHLRRRRVPVAPRETVLVADEMRRVLVLDDLPEVRLVHPEHLAEHAGAEDVDEAVHLRAHALVVVAQRVVQ